MRRTYISPEFIKIKVNGSLNMVEESNYFSGKMLEIEDRISVIKEDIIWYQRLNGEQLDFNVESSLDSYVYSSSISKQNNHKISKDEKQSDNQLKRNTKWILDISLNDVLIEYIFSNLKRWRTFEGLKSEFTLEKDINVSIKKYINENIIDRYNFNRVELFVEYNDLRSDNLLRFNNKWSSDAKNRHISIETITDPDQKKLKVLFEQDKFSSDFNFNYYFNVFFNKK